MNPVHPERQGRLAVVSAFLAIAAHATVGWVAWNMPGAEVTPPPLPLEVRFIEESPPDVLPAPLPVAPPAPPVVPPDPPKPEPPPPEPPKPEPPKPKPPKPKPVVRKPPPKPVPVLVAEAPAAVEAPSAPPTPEVAEAPPAVLPAAPMIAAESAPVAAAPRAPNPGPVASAPVTAPRFDAAYLSNPAPKYPQLSRRMGEEGRVLLRVYVEPDGRAAKVEMRTSSGFARLDEAALGAVRNWRFVPAKRGEESVAAWVIVPINFTLRNS